MKQFGIDYQVLDKQINRKTFPLAEVKDKITKVAFDVVKFNDAIEGLWKIEKSPDGEVIVALYEETLQKEAATKIKSNWVVVTNYDKDKFAFFYKNEPVTQIPISALGINKAEVDQVLSWLPEKLATNKNLYSNILKMANNYQLSIKFPELFEVK